MKGGEEVDSELLLNDGIVDVSYLENELSDSEERIERIRYSEVHRKKDFTYIERLYGRDINLLQGLKLHTDVFNVTEQNEIVDYIYRLQRLDKKEDLDVYSYFILPFNYTTFIDLSNIYHSNQLDQRNNNCLVVEISLFKGE
ncbi:2-oxoglutarate (2OG) and Fe(II)-dependent oxygenase superfamily protein [Trifolium repens]|nr:2-oxoglutarate (2OG) and Fe(II)-dependent oxygenase superfamily protein [Trifolium repens]